MGTDKTLIESGATLHDSYATLRENDPTRQVTSDSQATLRECGEGSSVSLAGNRLAGMSVLRQLPTRGSEADIFVVDDGAGEKILKLYRLDVKPKREVLERYEAISAQHPEHVVRVFRTGRDQETGRWFELLELIHYGSVADWLEKGKPFCFEEFVRELSSAVHAMHEAGIIHRDLKPGNVLVRSPKPLDLVLTDFGIASILDGASLRETIHKGLTPMYAAPENVAGKGDVVSAPADWWACGMIFLEILTGSHPFRNFETLRVLRALATQNVEIDPSLPEEQQILLKGLLTRNDKKRWGWPQIEAWLRGERNIPVHYEEEGGSQQRGPDFRFMDKDFQSLHDMALAFAENYEAWKAGRGTLARGGIATWLRDSHEFDEERIVSDELADNNADLYLARFIAHYAPELPPNIYGLELTSANLLAWLSKPKEQLTEAENGVINTVIFSKTATATLADFLKIYHHSDDTQDANLVAISKEKWRKPEDLQLALHALLSPDTFYWGPDGPPQGPDKVLGFLKKNSRLITNKIWEEMDGPQMIFPPSVLKIFQDGSYDQGMAEIARKKEEGSLLYINDGLCPDGVFNGDDREYIRLVGKKHGLNQMTLDLLEKTHQLIANIRQDPGKLGIDMHKELELANTYVEEVQSGRRVWGQGHDTHLRKVYRLLRRLSASATERKIRFFFSPGTLIIAAICLFFIWMLFTMGTGLEHWIRSSPYVKGAFGIAGVGAVLLLGVFAEIDLGIVFLVLAIGLGLIWWMASAAPYIFAVLAILIASGIAWFWGKMRLKNLDNEKPALLLRLNQSLLALYGENEEHSQNG